MTSHKDPIIPKPDLFGAFWEQHFPYNCHHHLGGIPNRREYVAKKFTQMNSSKTLPKQKSATPLRLTLRGRLQVLLAKKGGDPVHWFVGVLGPPKPETIFSEGVASSHQHRISFLFCWNFCFDDSRIGFFVGVGLLFWCLGDGFRAYLFRTYGTYGIVSQMRMP